MCSEETHLGYLLFVKQRDSGLSISFVLISFCDLLSIQNTFLNAKIGYCEQVNF